MFWRRRHMRTYMFSSLLSLKISCHFLSFPVFFKHDWSPKHELAFEIQGFALKVLREKWKEEKKIKDHFGEEDISFVNCCFVFSSDTLENRHQLLFPYFLILHLHFHIQLEKQYCFLHFFVSMDKTVPKSKVHSNWQGINGWQTFWEWFPCQRIGMSLGKAVLNITIHSCFLSHG